LPGGGEIVITPDGEVTITVPETGGTITMPNDEEIEVPGGSIIVICPEGEVTIVEPPGPYREFHRTYMFGNPQGYFRPGATITRAEVAAILVRTELRDFEAFAVGAGVLPDGMTSFTEFPDVNPNNWFYYYVAWAFEADLIRGLPDGTFRPNQPITRQEIAAMMSRLDGVEYRQAGTPTGIVDFGNTQDWARNYVYTVYRAGLMVGNAAGYFNPRANITRAETATVFNRNLNRVDSLAAYEPADVTREHARNFPDVPATNAAGTAMPWFFPAVLAATNDHYLSRNADGTIAEMYVRYEQPWHETDD